MFFFLNPAFFGDRKRLSTWVLTIRRVELALFLKTPLSINLVVILIQINLKKQKK